MPDAHSFSVAIGLLVFLYLAGLLVIARRLKAVHNPVWIGLGSPSLLNWSISSSFRLGAFVFLHNGFSRLEDSALSWLVWSERAMLLVVVAVIAFWKFHYR